MFCPNFLLLSDEREAVQKKTFTKWVNSILSRVGCRISDLYLDLRDGRMLIKLLEVLSGERLVKTLTPQWNLTLLLLWELLILKKYLKKNPNLLSSLHSLNRPKAGCVSTAWRTWTRLCSSSKNRGFTWRTWGHMTSWTVTIVSSWVLSGPSSCASRWKESGLHQSMGSDTYLKEVQIT